VHSEVREDIQRMQDRIQELATDVAVLKSTWALALKWGAGAGAAVAATVAVLKEVF
jgi:hypothetical protein